MTTENTNPAAHGLLRGIDNAAFVTSFVARLRRAGIRVGLTEAQSFSRAMAVSSFADDFETGGPRTRLYWTARITLVDTYVDLAAFDSVFAAVFEDAVFSLDPPSRRQNAASAAEDRNVTLPAAEGEDEDDTGLPWATLPTVTGIGPDSDSPLSMPERRPSDQVSFADTPFEDFDAGDLRRLDQSLRAALRDWPRRKSRRLRKQARGRRIAMRQTTARARHTGWETVTLIRHGAVIKDRRLVMLCDVSQSMQPYVTAYLHFMRAATLVADGEVFAFATSLTRLTPVLKHKSPEAAIDEASATVGDRFGGTRIASNLRALLRSHHGNAVRGSVFIIASDGWDSEPPQELSAQMARLRRRAHRIIWLNPRAAEPGFVPLVGAMAAALPYCDEFLPAHNVTALDEAIASIGNSR
ncbi:MAG: vWA domain-containing protein [Aeromicrobium sp.]